MCAQIFCWVVTVALFLTQYLKMRFGRGMQLLGSIQFLVVTVRSSDVPRWHNNVQCMLENEMFDNSVILSQPVR